MVLDNIDMVLDNIDIVLGKRILVQDNIHGARQQLQC